MPTEKQTTLFFFTDKHGRSLSGLSKENNALDDIFAHYTSVVSYKSRVDFQDKDFNAEFAANGANASIFHIGAHGNSHEIFSSYDNDYESLLTANRFFEYLEPCKNLKLVFLNACKSNDIAAKLKEKLSIPLIIGTTDDIDDDFCSKSV